LARVTIARLSDQALPGEKVVLGPDEERPPGAANRHGRGEATRSFVSSGPAVDQN